MFRINIKTFMKAFSSGADALLRLGDSRKVCRASEQRCTCATVKTCTVSTCSTTLHANMQKHIHALAKTQTTKNKTTNKKPKTKNTQQKNTRALFGVERSHGARPV